MHLAAFLPPHTWKRAEGGPRLCPPPPLSPVKGQWSVPSQRWQMAGEEVAPTCGGGPLHSRRQIRSIIPASLDSAALPWSTRATCASMSPPCFTTTEPTSANKAVEVDERAARVATLADLQTTTDCFRKCVGMTKIKPTQCDCVPLLSATLDGVQRR